MARTLPARARRRSLRATARAVSVTTAATAAVAAGAFAAPAAAGTAQTVAVPAADPAPGLIEVAPNRVQPGTEIRVRVEFCETERTAMATSVAFEADIDLKRTPDGTAFHGSALISVSAEPGTYGITVVCGVNAREKQSSFKVVPAGGDRHGGHPGRDGHHEPPPVHASPVAPVRAGGGGTAGGGPAGDAQTAQRVGLTMAGGAAVAGAVVWVVRRRRAGAHTGG